MRNLVNILIPTLLILLLFSTHAFSKEKYDDYQFDNTLSVKIPSEWIDYSPKIVKETFVKAQEKSNINIENELKNSTIKIIAKKDNSAKIMLIVENHDTFKNEDLNKFSENDLFELNSYYYHQNNPPGNKLYKVLGWADLQVFTLDKYNGMTFGYLKESFKDNKNREVTTYFVPFGNKSFTLAYECLEGKFDENHSIVIDILFSLKNQI